MKKTIKNITFNLFVRNNILNENNIVYCLIINKKYYIGKTNRKFVKRLQEHVGKHIHSNDNVIAFVLDKCFTIEELRMKEKKRIRQYGNKILKRFYSSNKEYNNPLLFTNLKNHMINKTI